MNPTISYECKFAKGLLLYKTVSPTIKLRNTYVTCFGHVSFINAVKAVRRNRSESRFHVVFSSDTKANEIPTKTWGSSSNLSQGEIDRLVIAYLQEYGKVREFDLICDLQQKTPEIRASLKRVAVCTKVASIDYERYWKVKEC